MFGPYITVTQGAGRPDQAQIQEPTLEKFKECGELVQEGLPPGNIRSYPKDYARADEAAGIIEKVRKQAGYTWHHYQDGKTMQLIRKDVHKEFFHTGGMAGTRQECSDAD